MKSCACASRAAADRASARARGRLEHDLPAQHLLELLDGEPVDTEMLGDDGLRVEIDCIAYKPLKK